MPPTTRRRPPTRTARHADAAATPDAAPDPERPARGGVPRSRPRRAPTALDPLGRDRHRRGPRRAAPCSCPATRSGSQSAAQPGTPASEDAGVPAVLGHLPHVNDRYAGGDVDRNALIQGAIKGMIDALGDPYSAYLTSRGVPRQPAGHQRPVRGDRRRDRDAGRRRAPQGCATLGPDCRLVDHRADRRLAGREGRAARRATSSWRSTARRSTG